MSKKELKITDLSINYGSNNVLKNINLTIPEGDFLGIIGPNGAGKSTLLKAINNLIPISNGKIEIEGKNILKVNSKDRAKEIALVPQNFNIEYDFSVKDIILMGRFPHLKSGDYKARDYEKVKEAIELTHTKKFENRLFKTLSGGEKQRVIIARAIAQDTNIILLDEPTSALDLHHQYEIMELISDLNKKGKTIITVMHDLNLAARFCKNLLILKKGEIKDLGKPEEVLTVETLKDVYHMNMIVRENEFYHRPEIIPLNISN